MSVIIGSNIFNHILILVFNLVNILYTGTIFGRNFVQYDLMLKIYWYTFYKAFIYDL